MPVDFFYSTSLAVPITQIVILLMLITVALLFRRIKLALLINYIFTLYWGYFFNRDLFFDVESVGYFLLMYFGFGFLIVVFAMIGFIFCHEQ